MKTNTEEKQAVIPAVTRQKHVGDRVYYIQSPDATVADNMSTERFCIDWIRSNGIVDVTYSILYRVKVSEKTKTTKIVMS